MNRKKLRLSTKISIIITFVILISFLFFFMKFGLSGSYYRDKLSQGEMKTDTDYFINTLRQNHTEMKGIQNAYSETISNIYNKIKVPMNSEDFYWTLNTLLVALKDGHTHLSTDEINRDCIDLPHLEWTSDGLIISQNKASFMTGDRIISIGGITPAEMLNKLKGLIPAEIVEYVKVNTDVVSEGMYLRHLKLVDKNSNVTVKYERNGKLHSVALHLHKNKGTLLDSIKKSISYEANRSLKWKIDKVNNLGIITINTCPSGKQYVNGFRNFFNAVSKNNIQNIAVDLRNNDGGSDTVINQFLSFIDVDYYNFIGENSYMNSPEDFRDVTKNDPPPYKGKIYVLSSNITFSAGTDFVVVLQANSIAKVVGQPTGNTASFFGNARQVSLPNSKLLLNYSTTKNSAPVPEDEQNKAIVPDYKVENSRRDIIEKRDPWINFVIKLSHK